MAVASDARRPGRHKAAAAPANQWSVRRARSRCNGRRVDQRRTGRPPRGRVPIGRRSSSDDHRPIAALRWQLIAAPAGHEERSADPFGGGLRTSTSRAVGRHSGEVLVEPWPRSDVGRRPRVHAFSRHVVASPYTAPAPRERRGACRGDYATASRGPPSRKLPGAAKPDPADHCDQSTDAALSSHAATTRPPDSSTATGSGDWSPARGCAAPNRTPFVCAHIICGSLVLSRSNTRPRGRSRLRRPAAPSTPLVGSCRSRSEVDRSGRLKVHDRAPPPR